MEACCCWAVGRAKSSQGKCMPKLAYVLVSSSTGPYKTALQPQPAKQGPPVTHLSLLKDHRTCHW